MYIDNITSDSMTLTYNGKAMLIKVYEEEIERLKEQLNDEIDDELKQSEIMVKKQEEIERLNNIINEIERDIKNLYTYGIKNNAEQKNYLLNRLEGLKEYRGSDKE